MRMQTRDEFLKELVRDLKKAIYEKNYNMASNLTRRMADALVCGGDADGTPLEWLYDAATAATTN